jgi:chromate transporter
VAAARDDGPPPFISDDVLHAEPLSARRTLRVLLVGLVVWSVPVAVAALLTKRDSVFM